MDLCGEGEWFVGTRGGSADHAAVKMGQIGKVAKVTFFELAVEKMVDFPADYRVVICNSRQQAKKTASARDVFNQQVTCYHLGRMLVKKLYPQYAPLIQHLRDINTRTLGIPLSWIYRILLRLPERASRAELREMLPGANLDVLFATHAEPAEGYAIRDVVAFGLAECERSRIAADLLGEGEVEAFGQLMNVSHNGDRVVAYDEAWQPHPYPNQVSNSYLVDLIESLESGDAEPGHRCPVAVAAGRLSLQHPRDRPDGGCGPPDQGRHGGADCRGRAGRLHDGIGARGCHGRPGQHMTEIYYAPRDLEPDISVCMPIAGSGVSLWLLNFRGPNGRNSRS